MISVFDVFADGTFVKDYYSGATTEVIDGKVSFETDADLLLIGLPFE